MEQETEGHLVSDHRLLSQRTYQQIGMTFVGLCFLVGTVYVGYLYYAGPIIAEEQDSKEFESIVADLASKQKEMTYEIVPQALSELTIPDPVEPSQADLLREFSEATKSLPETLDSEMPSLYNMPVGEITYVEYLSNLPLEIQQPLYQMHVELRHLTTALNKKYPQVSLAERAGKPEAVRFIESASNLDGALSVYPSLNVVESYFVAEVLAKEFPSQASFFREYADMYIKNGIAYGHYSALDARIATLLVDDYLTQAEKSEQGKVALQTLEQ